MIIPSEMNEYHLIYVIELWKCQLSVDCFREMGYVYCIL